VATEVCLEPFAFPDHRAGFVHVVKRELVRFERYRLSVRPPVDSKRFENINWTLIFRLAALINCLNSRFWPEFPPVPAFHPIIIVPCSDY